MDIPHKINSETSISCYHKPIRLYPTLFYVDVWICDDKSYLAKVFNKYYGASVEFYEEEEIFDNYVGSISSKDNSEFKGDTRFVLKIIDLNDIGILIHELNHVYYHLCNKLNIELSFKSQEWHSYMLEYLYEESKEINTYTKIEI